MLTENQVRGIVERALISKDIKIGGLREDVRFLKSDVRNLKKDFEGLDEHMRDVVDSGKKELKSLITDVNESALRKILFRDDFLNELRMALKLKERERLAELL